LRPLSDKQIFLLYVKIVIYFNNDNFHTETTLFLSNIYNIIYLNNLRLKHACNMLINTNEPISIIARESGYNSTEYFLYIFKKYMLTSPAKYRNAEKDIALEYIP